MKPEKALIIRGFVRSWLKIAGRNPEIPCSREAAKDRPESGAFNYFCCMVLPFFKYHGTGNDFILVDNRNGAFRPDAAVVRRLCDRHFGIGSDGLILIELPVKEGEDFYMNFYNPDGSSSFCGNGSRCAVKFAAALGIEKDRVRFSAIDGSHEAETDGEIVSVKMRDVREIITRPQEEYFLHTGSPHVVKMVQGDVNTHSLQEVALPVRHHKDFQPAGTNVNLVLEEHPGSIAMRTFERGVEDETLSCGTGVTAAALVHGFRHPGIQSVTVMTRGGELKVTFEQIIPGTFQNIYLSGPAVAVYSGHISTE